MLNLYKVFFYRFLFLNTILTKCLFFFFNYSSFKGVILFSYLVCIISSVDCE